MRVIVTGAGGLMGQEVSRVLAARGSLRGRPIERLTLLDLTAPPVAEGAPFPIEARACDVTDANAVREAFAGGAHVVFHFAAIMSGAAERRFEDGWLINLDGTRNVLNACLGGPTVPVLVFTSTIALYGAHVEIPVRDDAPARPETPYGTQKLIMELMLDAYSRRGIVDARTVRIPHVAIREDDLHQGAGGFITAILKAPLLDRDAVCPVDPSTRVCLITPAAVLASLIHLAELPDGAMDGGRVVQLPGTTVSVAQMLEALRRVAPPERLSRIRFEPDPAFARLLSGLPEAFDAQRARRLGFPLSPDIDGIIAEYAAKLATAPPRPRAVGTEGDIPQ